jgi:hypothetical protein
MTRQEKTSTPILKGRGELKKKKVISTMLYKDKESMMARIRKENQVFFSAATVEFHGDYSYELNMKEMLFTVLHKRGSFVYTIDPIHYKLSPKPTAAYSQNEQ